MNSVELTARGRYWITRLAAEYQITVPTSCGFRFAPQRGTYGHTWMRRPPLVELHPLMADQPVRLIDEMLVHELIHASGINDHGAEFKRRYGRVYPWSRPGVVTEHDPGTPRRELWREITTALPRGSLR